MKCKCFLCINIEGFTSKSEQVLAGLPRLNVLNILIYFVQVYLGNHLLLFLPKLNLPNTPAHPKIFVRILGGGVDNLFDCGDQQPLFSFSSSKPAFK